MESGEQYIKKLEDEVANIDLGRALYNIMKGVKAEGGSFMDCVEVFAIFMKAGEQISEESENDS
jgi:hypothetical protein